MLNERMVLNFYLDRLENDQVKFLRRKDRLKENIKKLVIELREEEKIHEKIELSKRIWKLLFEGAMSYLDPDKIGFDKLFKYFDKYVQFEELIFASDSFYRDHTMHCLWVYFLGEYIRCEGKFEFFVCEIGEKHPEYHMCKKYYNLFNDFTNESNKFSGILQKLIKSGETFDAKFCIAALTHDLGYPIKKINKINKCMKEIMPFFSIYNLDEFNFQYENIQQKYVEDLIWVMSLEPKIDMNMSISDPKFREEVVEKMEEYDEDDIESTMMVMKELLNENEKSWLDKNMKLSLGFVRDVDSELRYAKDFESYNHGIMSAYLLMNTVSAFKNIGLKYLDLKELNHQQFNDKMFIEKQEILKAITNHTSEGYRIDKIRGISEFLAIIDEIEEFSRISRANKNRQYVNEFCKSEIYGEDDYFCIDFIFDSEEIENLDPQFAFKGRCKRFLQMFDIFNMEEYLKIRLRCIGRLPHNNSTYELKIKKRYAHIKVDGVEVHIPDYLNSNEILSREEYELA